SYRGAFLLSRITFLFDTRLVEHLRCPILKRSRAAYTLHVCRPHRADRMSPPLLIRFAHVGHPSDALASVTLNG
ncbi:hypothetical protein MRY87_01835, partial [bacterium]|nr:hypothetical protein [bacterium]